MDYIDLPPNPAGLIEGLRDTGYTFNNALADIIDNSIDAKAKEISILIQLDVEGKIVISVTDNGIGMTKERLVAAMAYGSRSDKGRDRLGKFGLGLKTASTAFCRRLSVISRSTDCVSNKVTWDLDYVAKTNKWHALQSPATKDEVALIDRISKGGSGTLVLWENVDRAIKVYDDPAGSHARKALDKLIGEFTEHAALVYHRFLETPIGGPPSTLRMTINGKPLIPWDPFCENLAGTKKVVEKEVGLTLPDGSDASFTFRAFVLPRADEIADPVQKKNAKISADNQGIYIYRERRLIHCADWLGMYSIEPHYTLLRAEISFTHTLDEAFQVDIKKSRISLDDTLYENIRKFLAPPRNAANERYRDGVKKQITKSAADVHAGSNVIIGDKYEQTKTSSTAEIKPTETPGVSSIKNQNGTFTIKIPSDTNISGGEVFVHPVDSIDDGLLWLPALIDGKHAVRINTGHDFYRKVYLPANSGGRSAVKGMDSLLWSLVEAELSATSEGTVKHFKMLRYEVSRLLRILVEDFPEPQIDAE